jgi:hypothetical protein
MSRKVFTAGQVLAASDVNNFLMDQTVMSFAGTAARGSAIGTAVEGMTTYLEDTNYLSVYDGASWASSLPVGAWAAFTPTWAGLTIGNGVFNTCHFARIGKTVHLAVDFVLGTTSAVTGDVNIFVPASIARKNTGGNGLSYSFYYQTGTANFMGSTLTASSNATQWLIRYPVTGSFGTGIGVGALSATAPFTWGNTHRLQFAATYEAI